MHTFGWTVQCSPPVEQFEEFVIVKLWDRGLSEQPVVCCQGAASFLTSSVKVTFGDRLNLKKKKKLYSDGEFKR